MSIISFERLKERISEYKFVFAKPKSIKEHLEVIFVFGGTSDSAELTSREQFISYASTCTTPFKFITIEDIYNDLKKFGSNTHGVSAQRTALVELELRAIKQAYSLIIFPESVGSYTELGYFTAIEETKQKICIANHVKYSHSKSYLNHIIDVVHNHRDIRPLIMDFDSKVEDKHVMFNQLIESLIEDYEENKHIKKFISSELFPLAVTYEIIKLLPILTFTQLTTALEIILENFKDAVFMHGDLTVIISMLVVASLIERYKKDEQFYFRVINSEYSLIDTNLTEKEKAKLLLLQISNQEEDSIGFFI